MKLRHSQLIAAGLLILAPLPGAAQSLEVLPPAEPQRAFGGDTRTVNVTLRNPGAAPVKMDARMRLLQTTSATAAPLDERPWKKLEVLPGQTIVESAALDLPAVRGVTRFVIQWMESNRSFGSTDVLVYPTNLLATLRPLLGKEAVLGVFDPHDILKPLLKGSGVEFVDLGNTVLEDFRGKLAIIGPFESKTQMPQTLPGQIQTLASKGVAVVWLVPHEQSDKPRPSFHTVPANRIATVVAQPEVVARLSDDPQSQLNLIYFCRLALNPEPLRLPGTTSQL